MTRNKNVDPKTVLYCTATSDIEAKQKLSTLIRYTRTQHKLYPDADPDDLAEELVAHDSRITQIYSDVPVDAVVHRPDQPWDSPEAVRRLAANNETKRVIIHGARDTTIDLLDDINTRGVTIHLVRDGLTVYSQAPVAGTVGTALRALTGDTPDAEDLLSGVEWDGGRPPLGTTSEYGELQPDDNYDEVRRQLRRVRRGVESQRGAAREIGCAPSTIDAALKRPSLYGLDATK